MLYQLGPLTIDTFPFETHDVNRRSGADFAAKDVVGVQRPREFMGEGDEYIVLIGTLFPLRMQQLYGRSGLDELATLNTIRAAGQPNILVRGDGANLGWFLVEDVQERNTRLMATGVGKIIEYELRLVKSPTSASAASMLDVLTSLLS